MLAPIEMRRPLPMTLHGSGVTMTTEVWSMLAASEAGDLEHVARLVAHRPELRTCKFNYTSPLHFAVREGHVTLVKELVAAGAFDPSYKSYPFGDDLLTMARDREYEEIVGILEDAARNPELAKSWSETGNIDYRQDTKQARFDRALHDSKLREVDRLLTARPDLATNELSSWAEGVLMMPAKKRDFRVLELLLRRGAQVPDLSKWGRFYYFKHADVAQLLLESGMSARHQTWQRVTLLHDMAQSGDLAKAAPVARARRRDRRRRRRISLHAAWVRGALGANGHGRLVAGTRRGREPRRRAWSTPLAWARKKGHGDIERALVGRRGCMTRRFGLPSVQPDHLTKKEGRIMKGLTRRYAAVLGIAFLAVPVITFGDIDRSAVDFVAPADIKWVRNEAGTSEQAVLFGDPTKPGPYVIRIRWLPGNMSRPHFHSTDRFFIVLEGTWWLGTGTKFDPDSTVAVKPGTYVFHKAGGVHYDGAKGEPAVIQVWGTGPMTTTSAEVR